MQRAGFVLIGILVLSLAASALAEATMVLGHRSLINDEAQLRPSATATPKTSPSPSVSTTPAPLTTATPAPSTPPPVPSAPTATTVSFVHMRAGASTATAIVTDLNAGSVVTLGAYADSQWQQVAYNGFSGYVFKAYLQY